MRDYDSADLMISVLPERGDLEHLSHEDAEEKLKVVLATLALYNIIINRCEHVNARETLIVIYDDHSKEERVFPNMACSGWTLNLSGSSNCADCEKEHEAMLEKYRHEQTLSGQHEVDLNKFDQYDLD